MIQFSTLYQPVDDKKKVVATLPYNKVPDTDELR